MARPRKRDADRRCLKIIVWVTAAEQARYLVNSARTGLTGPDYIRAIACASPPVSVIDAQAAELVLSLTPKEHAALLARAGVAGIDVRRYVIDRALQDAPSVDPATQFEAVDSLMRIGTLLHRLVDITRATGVVPDEVLGVIDRVERALEQRLTG